MTKWIDRWLEPIFSGWLGFLALYLSFFFSFIPGMEILGLFVLVIALANRRRLDALGVVNFALIAFFSISMWGRQYRSYLLADQDHPLGDQRFLLARCLALILFFALFWGLWRVHLRTRFRWIFSLNFGALMLLFLGFQWAGTFLPAFYFYIWRTLLVLFSRYFWMIAFSHISVPRDTRIPLRDWMASMPFWMTFSNWQIGVIPRGVGELRSCQANTPEEARAARWAGLKLIALGWICYWLWNYSYPVYDWLSWPDFANLNLADLKQLHAPAWQLWTFGLIDGVQFVLRNVYAVSLIVGTIRFCGFNVPPSIFALFRSRNFGDFIRHFYYYYSETLAYFFMPTTWRIVRFFGPAPSLQNGLVVFLALFVGGTVLHFIEYIQYAPDNLTYAALMALKFVPYLFLMGLFVGISVSFHRAGKPAGLRILPTLFYFLLYFVCRMFARGFPSDYTDLVNTSLGDYFGFIGSLFGF